MVFFRLLNIRVSQMTPRRQDDDGAAATQTQGAGHNENVQPRANGRPLTGDQVPRPGTTATRGRSAERAIQTVLNLVRHVSAFSDDIDRVANSYNNEIEQGKQIEELSKSLEQTKLQESEELVELRKKATWLEKLKKKVAEAEEKHREIVADLNHDHTVQIAAKESELRSNKQKLQKLREVLKAEAKRESQKECEELEAQRGRLTEELQCLEKKTTADAKTAAATMATMNTTIENKDSRYQRAEENFERLERRYKAELEKLGSEFAVDMNPPDF